MKKENKYKSKIQNNLSAIHQIITIDNNYTKTDTNINKEKDTNTEKYNLFPKYFHTKYNQEEMIRNIASK